MPLLCVIDINFYFYFLFAQIQLNINAAVASSNSLSYAYLCLEHLEIMLGLHEIFQSESGKILINNIIDYFLK